MMRTSHDEVLDDLAALVAGESGAIARHADHLASCDDCRDARHDAAQLAKQLADAGADHVTPADLVERVMAKLDAPKIVEAPVEKPQATPAKSSKPRRTKWIALGAAGALAAGAAGLYLMHSDAPRLVATSDGPIGKIGMIARAGHGEGVAIKTASGWRPLRLGEMVPAGAELRTDERTRSSLELADGTGIVLDHATTLAFDAREPRELTLVAGRIAADVVHVDKHPASVTTKHTRIDVVGTRFTATATETTTSVHVVRGAVRLAGEEVRAGEEGIFDHGKVAVSAVPQLAKESAWAELGKPAQPDDALAGLGALRAYKPGEKRDRDWKLALASHDVKVRISGPIARTEITETFRNDSDTQLEGVYQFPLPADAQIDSLALDMAKEPGGFIAGAFVDKQRAQKIWKGVIDKAAPHRDPLIQEEIVWVPGPWRDPALLDWKRGGRFELRIFPIPAKGARTIKLAYTQVVTPRGAAREYVYPLPHSSDGSTVADAMKIDVEVRGAKPGTVRSAGYDLKADQTRNDVSALSFAQGGFVPRGDLVIDYRPDSDAELRAWTFAGGAAVGPDAKLAAKKQVGIDPKVVDAQRAVAADARPTAVLALAPKLPRSQDAKPRDYAIVVDGSQSMVGERFARASQLATALVGDLDSRDRFNVLVCDSECKKLGDLRAAARGAASEVKSWLAMQQPAGASDLVASLRAGRGELTDAQRERWVIFVGDGFATTGFRRVADVERALAGTEVRITTIGIGSDADSALLAAAARGGGGSYVAWTPGLSAATAALAALESTNGTSLRDATLELPAGLSEVAAAGGSAGETTTTTSLPTLRAGSEVLVAARLAGDVKGEVVLRGKVGGEKFEQRYPVELHVSTAAGNGFVPRLWATLAIDQIERQGGGEDRARIVALSQGYGVMSRETSLLVLESQAMFDAFGVDRGQPTTKWSGEEDIEESTASGTIQVAGYANDKGKGASTAAHPATRKIGALDDDESGGMAGEVATEKKDSRPPPAPAKVSPGVASFGGGGRRMVPMRRIWERHAALGTYEGVNASIAKAVTDANDALVNSPDSREKHRALVQALAYAGELDKAREIAGRWLDRDKLDPQALGYIADLLGRDGKRDLALRTLAGLVDLEPDRAALHERMVNAYERSGRVAQACGHRIALVTLDAKQAAKRAGAAARCLRALGRADDADLVMKSLVDDKARTEAEKLATVAPVEPRIAGDLVITGKWDATNDLDISLIAPDGTRVSWMGGRSDVTVADSTAHDREELSVRRLKKGNYLIEISRGETSSAPVHGTLDISALGVKKAMPFELAGSHATVGKIAVTLTPHLVPVNSAEWL